MENEQITCVDCGQPFEFTDGEQKWFAEKGYAKPKRCKACRQARKTERPNPKR